MALIDLNPLTTIIGKLIDVLIAMRADIQENTEQLRELNNRKESE